MCVEECCIYSAVVILSDPKREVDAFYLSIAAELYLTLMHFFLIKFFLSKTISIDIFSLYIITW